MPDQDEERTIRLLLVDDEREFLHATAAALSRRGFEVTPVPNAFGAMRCLERSDFDLIVIDLELPGMEGDELFAELRASHPNLPLMILSGHVDESLAEQFAHQGAVAVAAKPCDIDRLARLIRRAVDQAGQTPGEDSAATG